MSEETQNSPEFSSASVGYFGDSIAPHLQEVTTMDHNVTYSNSLAMNSSGSCATKGRSVKEFEEQISTLKKENFNLKLRIFFLEEKMGANFNMNSENIVKKNVELMVEVETLKKELNEKHELLCEAVKAMELEDEEHKNLLRDKDALILNYLQEIDILKTQIIKHGDGVDVSVQSVVERKDPRCELLLNELEKTRSKVECYDKDLRLVTKRLEETQAKYQSVLKKTDDTNEMMETIMQENAELHMTCASLKSELERECKRHDRLKLSSDQKIMELQQKLEAALGELKKSQELVVSSGVATRPSRDTDVDYFSVSKPTTPTRFTQKNPIVFPATFPTSPEQPTLMLSSPTSPLPSSTFVVDLASLGEPAHIIEELKNERELYQQKIIKLKSEQMKACNIIKSMMESRKKSDEEIADLKRRNEHLQDALRKGDNGGQQPSLSSLHDELADYKCLTDELEEKNRILKMTLTETQSQFESIKSQLATKDNKIIDLEFELISYQQGDHRLVDDAIKAKDEEISILKRKLKKLTCDLQLLVNTELWSKNREIEKLQKAQASISSENRDGLTRLHRELSTKDSQLTLIKERIADLGIDFDLNSPDLSESPVKSRLKLELEKSEKLRFDAIKVCAILSGRLEELALFLDSLLKQKSVLGFLNVGEDLKIRKVIDDSLDLSRGFSLGGITDESLRQFLTLNESTTCDLTLGDLSLTYDNHLRHVDPEDSQIIDALRQQIVNLQYQLQLRDVELNKLNVGTQKVGSIEQQSESEAWSEPDRSVSRARIGLDESRSQMARNSSDSGELDVVKRSPSKKSENKSQKQLNDLADKLRESENHYAEEKSRSQVMTQQLDDLKAKLNEAERKSNESEAKRKEYELKVVDLEGELSELDTIRLNLLNNLSTKDKELQNRLNELEVERQQAMNSAKEAEHTVAKTEDDLKTCQKEIEHLSNQIAMIKNSYESELKQAECEIQELQEIIKDLHRDIAENYLLKSEVVVNFEENQRLLSNVNDYKMELDSALDREKILRDKIDDLQKSIDGLRGDLDGATLQYSEAVLEKTKITNEKIFFEQERTHLISEQQQLTTNLASLERELCQLKSTYNGEKSMFEMQQSRLYIQISELESTNAELHNKLVRIQAGCLIKTSADGSGSDLENNRNGLHHVYVADFERQETNSSPDLGIESDQGRFSSLENHISRPFLQTLELTESMNNLLDVDTGRNQYSAECCDNDSCCQKALKITQENAELRRRLLKTRKALEETVTQLTLANQRKKQVEKTICKQIHKTSQVLRKAKANLDSGSETEAYKK